MKLLSGPGRAACPASLETRWVRGPAPPSERGLHRPRRGSEDVGDVVRDAQVADAPRSVGPAEGEVVVPGLDGLDGALGAEGAGGPPARGLRGSDDVERDELGLDAGLVAIDG